MALTNWDLITLGNTIRNIDFEGEDITAPEWQVLLNANSKRLFSDLLGTENEYQPNFPAAKKGVSVTRKISQALRPFLNTETKAITGGNFAVSSLTYPIADLITMNPSTISGRTFDELEPAEWGDRLGSAAVSPTAKDPVFYWKNNTTILIAPSTITSIDVTYYKYPTDCVVATTYNATTLREEYNSGGSTELEWNDTEKLEILYMCLREIGVNLERQDLFQFGETTIKDQ